MEPNEMDGGRMAATGKDARAVRTDVAALAGEAADPDVGRSDDPQTLDPRDQTSRSLQEGRRRVARRLRNLRTKVVVAALALMFIGPLCYRVVSASIATVSARISAASSPSVISTP